MYLIPVIPRPLAHYPVMYGPNVIYADLLQADRYIQSIQIWYSLPGETKTYQGSMCGHDFMNWLRNVENQVFNSIEAYWYSTHPHARNTDVARYMTYRTNQQMNSSDGRRQYKC